MRRKPAVLFRPMILTDCCILYGAILRLRPKTAERFPRAALDYLRVSLEMIACSHADATANQGDVGAKRADALGALDIILGKGDPPYRSRGDVDAITRGELGVCRHHGILEKLKTDEVL